MKTGIQFINGAQTNVVSSRYDAPIAQKPNTTYFKNLPYPALVYNFILD